MLEIKPLPFNLEAFQPTIGSDTMYFHYEKHYAGYVAKANELTPPEMHNQSVESLVEWARKTKNQSLFNQVAQVWNHAFFFDGLTPQLTQPCVRLKELIVRDFQTLDQLKEDIVQNATNCFGSGWVWLVLDKNKLKIMKTSNAETLIGLDSIKPLWVLDVWEHAYYLDYQNRRADYAKAVVDKLINWTFVNQNLGI